MEFFNAQKGGAPLFKFLADNYTISDNYHQPVLGGTGADSQPLGFVDQLFYSDGKGKYGNSAGGQHLQSGPTAWNTQSLHASRAVVQLFRPNPAGIAAMLYIMNHLNSMPYALDTKCGPSNIGRP